MLWIIRLIKKAVKHLKDNGTKETARKTVRKIKGRLNKRSQSGHIKAQPLQADRLFWEKLNHIQPVKHIDVNRDKPRFNMVTDCLSSWNLFGGVATAIILSTIFAKKTGMPLRIITRYAENNPRDYFDFIDFLKLDKPENVEFYSDHERSYKQNIYKLEVSKNDIFMSTSWWTTKAIKNANRRDRCFYLLQETEYAFYPNGDDQSFCREILDDASVDYIINSKLLHDHYVLNGFKKITKNSTHFEPAFPKHIYFPGEGSFKSKDKKKLFFYSRPNNPRNLFYRGIKIIDDGFRAGILDKDSWDIYFAGERTPDLVFCNGAAPIQLGKLGLKEYADLLRTVDIGVCLMYTPHPSYPPLDVASSGGIVLTNRYENKQHMDYSENIICGDLEGLGMMDGLEKCVKLAQDPALRKKNYLNNNISTDWETSLANTIDFMSQRI